MSTKQFPVQHQHQLSDREKKIAFLRQEGGLLDRKEVQTRQVYGFEKLVSAKQRKLIEDPSQFILACCGRRSGKTYALLVMLLRKCLSLEHARCLYVAKTQKNARRILWDMLVRFNSMWKLGIDLNSSTLVAQFPNGAKLYLMGAKDRDAMDDFRGNPADLIVLDEVVTFGEEDLAYLLDSVLEPMLLDYEGSQLVLVSTPGFRRKGRWFELCADINEKGEKLDHGYSKHHWTWADNEYFPRWKKFGANWQAEAKKYIEEYRHKKGYTYDDPTWQVEYLGKWVDDTKGLVYKYDRNKNWVKDLPASVTDHSYVIGVDFGSRDSNAAVVWAYSQHDYNAYVVDVFKESRMDVTGFAEIVKALETRYKPTVIVGDPSAPAMIAEFRNRHNINIIPADNKDKLSWIRLINTDLLNGRIKITEVCGALEDEMEKLPWIDNERSGKIQEHPKYDNHLCDAMNYGYREVFHYMATAAPESKTWAQHEEERFMQQIAEEQEYIRQQKDGQWWTRLPI